MALNLTKELETGFTANYWKIISIRLLPNQTNINIALYKDSAARLANKASVEVKEYIFTDAENPCTSAALETESAYILCYNKLKSLPEFAEATDV